MSTSSGNRSTKAPITAETTPDNCCKRCGRQFPTWQGVSAHYRKCSVVVSSHSHASISQHQNDNIYRTPKSTEMVHDESYLQIIHDEWDDDNVFPRTTNETMPQERPATDSVDNVLPTQVQTFIQSLPLFNPAYVVACVRWGPKPTCVTNRVRITLQFLSCTSYGDGLSKKHMGVILKFIKSLRGPNSAVLPHSTEGCWSVMKTVAYPAFVHHKFEIVFTSYYH